jgi:hypothetical protein
MAGPMVYRRSSKLPWLVGLLVALATAAGTWFVARPSVAAYEKAGVVSSGPYEYVIFFTLFAGVTAFLIARRVLDGAATRTDEWSLHVAGQPTVQVVDLDGRLARLGYRLRFVNLDDGGAATGPAAPGQALLGTPLWITETRARGRQAGIVLRIAQPQPGQEGLGLVEIRDASGVYDELGSYLLVALGELIPGLRVKRLSSSEAAEHPAALAAMLPERPQFLARL